MMKTKMRFGIGLGIAGLLVAVAALLPHTVQAAQAGRIVTDSRGVAVPLPAEIHRVVTVSDGMIEGIMLALGVADTLVGVGSSCIQRNFNYTFPSMDGGSFTYSHGKNPVSHLYPKLFELPRVCESRSPVNYETLAELDPDLLILRIGCCSLRHIEDEGVHKTLARIDSLGIPTVVLYGTNAQKRPTIAAISEEIRIVGEIFDRVAAARRLAAYLEAQVATVAARTKEIARERQPRALILGLSPRARKAGGAGQVFGRDTIESFFIEKVVHAVNAFEQPGYFKNISAEHLLAMDPDLIVLCTASGYHPPRELYKAPYYQNLQELKAVKRRRVAALPWSPCNCSKRLEYPIDVMVIAKAAYPALFEDIDLAEWLLEFYRQVYGVDRQTARELRSVQWMDWTLENSAPEVPRRE
jgi:iron complex transport system substrate-binding protein